MSTHVHLVDEDEEQEIPGFDAEAFAMQALSSQQNLAAVIDHTLLKPEATHEQVIRLCREAAEHRFACAMVNPTWAALAYAELAGTGVPVGVVVGFPLGASLGTTKRDEAAVLVKIGAHDVDMVINVGLVKSGENQAVQQEIEGVVEVAHEAGAIVKVILWHQDEHGILFGRRKCGRRGDDARRGGWPLRGEGLGGDSHPGRCSADAGGGCEPDRRERERGDPGRSEDGLRFSRDRTPPCG